MSKLLLLYLTFVVGLVFLILPKDLHPIDFFLFSDMELYTQTHIYFILEKSIPIVLAYIIYSEATAYRGALKIFLWLVIADLADYLLSYSSVWFHIGDFPISMNIVKCLVFGLTILYVWVRPYFK